MAQRIQCPSCGRGLLARESALGARRTCPACLAEVVVPETGRETDAISAERSPRREDGLSCPRCGRTVEGIWITCPWCEEPLRGRGDGRDGGPDIDVRRDTRRTSGGVIVLAVIGALGIAWMGVTSFSALMQGQEYQPLLYLTVGVLFLAGLTTLIVFARSGGNPGAAGVRRVVVGTLAMAGGLVTIGVLTCLAIMVFFLVVCSAFLFRGH